jgi:3D (Asp-Asp-Asp) domain-containing protein
VKNKILAVLLALSVTVGTGTYLHYDNELSDARETISNLNEKVETKSAEIAKLIDVIKGKDKKIKNQKLVIEKSKKANEKNKKTIKSKDKEIKKLKREIENFKKRKERDDAKKREVQMPSRGAVHKEQQTITVVATGYIAMCDTGCTGITRTGIDITNHPSNSIIAVDPSVIPLHSKVKVTLPSGEVFYAVALDTGGAIQGHKIDVLKATHEEAVNFGFQRNVKVTILE